VDSGISISRRRLVESIRNDPFIDAAFIGYLIGREEWLDVMQRQARVYGEIGDIGEGTVTFRTYKEEVKKYIIAKFGRVYERGLENQIEKIGEEKARRAWRAAITLLLSKQLMDRAGVGLGKLLPAEYARLESIAPILNALVDEKTRKKGLSAPTAVRNVLKRLGGEQVANSAPILWWTNLVMESEVFEGLLKFHYIVASSPHIAEFVKSAEDYLARVDGHASDYNYMEYEVLKGLLSRCTELRGQYINKLQNAIIFVKLWRNSVKNPQAWSWFLKNEVLTYTLSVYLTEIQSLLGLGKLRLNISALLAPKSGVYGGPASALSALILMSPIFMQYAIEARREVAVTPADIVVALLRIIRSHGRAEDFSVDMREVAEEIVKFWDEKDISRRLKLYAKDDISPDSVYSKEALTTSLSLLINAGVSGISITTNRKPELRLPPRMLGFDSLYVRSEQFLTVLRTIWM
jgi:hypothetical protein